MSAVIAPSFGDQAAIRRASIGNAAFERAVKLGYCQIVARQFARIAKVQATDVDTPSSVAMRVVPPRSHSATGRRPGGSAA